MFLAQNRQSNCQKKKTLKSLNSLRENSPLYFAIKREYHAP